MLLPYEYYKQQKEKQKGVALLIIFFEVFLTMTGRAGLAPKLGVKTAHLGPKEALRGYHNEQSHN